jgi:hypothetical protein
MKRSYRIQLPAVTLASKWVVALVCLLLLKVYADNRNLFLDEQNLASNVAECSYAELTGAIAYGQAAPPLFLWARKTLGQLLGMWDWVLRLLPLLAGLLAIVLFRAVLLRHFQHYEVLLALLLLGLSPLYVQYATEFKQYMTDLLFAVGCLYAVHKLQPGTHLWHWLLWAVLGGVGIWLSMPAVFVLSGVLAFYLWPMRPFGKRQLRIVLLGLCWALCFLGYWQSLAASATDGHFLRSHKDALLGMQPGLHAVIVVLVQTFADMCMRWQGWLLPLLFVGFFAVGALALLWRHTGLGLLVLVPILATYTASLLNSYSLMARLILFLMPAYLFVCCAGIATIVRWAQTKGALWGTGAWLLPAGLCLAIVLRYSALPYLWTPYPSVQAQEGLQALKAQMAPNDVVCFTQFGYDAYRYYGQHYAAPIPLSGVTDAAIAPHRFDVLPAMMHHLRAMYPGRRIVLFDSHTWGDDLLNLRHYTRIQGAHVVVDQGATRAFVYLPKEPLAKH